MHPPVSQRFDLEIDREQTLAIAFDANGGIVAEHRATSAHRTRADFDLRSIFRMALAHEAQAMTIAHSHPSGDLRPSRADIETTSTIARLCADLGIRLNDHVIVTSNGEFSFRAARMM